MYTIILTSKYLKYCSLLTLTNFRKHQQNTAYPPVDGVTVVRRLLSFTTRDGHLALATPAAQNSLRNSLRHQHSLRHQNTTRARVDPHTTQANTARGLGYAAYPPSLRHENATRATRPGANINPEPTTTRPWDSGADEIVLSGHQAGARYDQISAHLFSQGYDSSNAIVSASLHRQIDGLERVGSPWDHHADEIVLFAFRCGQRVPRIAATLHRNGYESSVALVVASLNRQGVNV